MPKQTSEEAYDVMSETGETAEDEYTYKVLQELLLSTSPQPTTTADEEDYL